MNDAAVRVLLAGCAQDAPVPEPLDLGTFSASRCAGMNWLVSRIRIVIGEDSDPGAREVAARAVPWLLAGPPSRARGQAVLDALR